jgi:hypothetical protein
MPQYNFIDLSGQNFGRWVVIERDATKDRTYWICKCECGETKSVDSASLKSGKSISCGCYRGELNKIRGYKDLRGKSFGKLVAKSFVRKWGFPFWNCSCSCGNERTVPQSHLLNGKVTSCEKGRCSKKFQNIIGRKFGNLLVVDYAENYISPGGFKKSMWKCHCECGNTVNMATHQLLSGNVHSCGCINESKIAHQLKEYFRINYGGISEFKALKNEDTNQWLRFDIYLPSNGVFIEVHGIQHYQFTDYFHKNQLDFEHDKYLDKIKKDFAKRNGEYIEIDLRKIKTTEDAIKHIEKKL